MGLCGIFRPPVQGGSNELISKFLSSMILYNHPSYFKRGEINSCRLSPLPTRVTLKDGWGFSFKILMADSIQTKSEYPSLFAYMTLKGSHN